MRAQAPNSPFPRLNRPLPLDGPIEWEELPSLFDSLSERLAGSGLQAGGRTTVWDSTRPADIEPASVPEPFQEPLRGLAIREVAGPDVFRHFFGVLHGF